jgi:hypothetical protein
MSGVEDCFILISGAHCENATWIIYSSDVALPITCRNWKLIYTAAETRYSTVIVMTSEVTGGSCGL